VKLVDRTGKEWVVLGKVWDGTTWCVTQEKVYNGRVWKALNYSVSYLEKIVYYNINADSNIGVVVRMNTRMGVINDRWFFTNNN
jgi:hypothetical protein